MTPPKSLSPRTLKSELNGRSKSHGFPTLATVPAELEMRLTPTRPTLDNGARMRSAVNVLWNNAMPQSPDGVLGLTGEGWASGSWLVFEFPTVVGKYYVVDCRAQDYDPQGKPIPITMAISYDSAGQFGGTWTNVTSKGGHILDVFKATDTIAHVDLYWADPTKQDYHMAAFWGCDFGQPI
jgi:hypothetical protein